MPRKRQLHAPCYSIESTFPSTEQRVPCRDSTDAPDLASQWNGSNMAKLGMLRTRYEPTIPLSQIDTERRF